MMTCMQSVGFLLLNSIKLTLSQIHIAGRDVDEMQQTDEIKP